MSGYTESVGLFTPRGLATLLFAFLIVFSRQASVKLFIKTSRMECQTRELWRGLLIWLRPIADEEADVPGTGAAEEALESDSLNRQKGSTRGAYDFSRKLVFLGIFTI